jgi:hypothetical protein
MIALVAGLVSVGKRGGGFDTKTARQKAPSRLKDNQIQCKEEVRKVG